VVTNDAAHDESTTAESSPAGLDRRSLIRHAAIVGAAAWTAPVIIGSLASPAGAVTTDCIRVHIDVSLCGPLPTSASAWTNTCNSSLSASAITSSCGAALTDIPVSGATLASLGISRPVSPACGLFASALQLTKAGCTIVTGAAQSSLLGCQSGTISGNVISFGVGFSVTEYWLVIKCA
jgi:hypothetical protein